MRHLESLRIQIHDAEDQATKISVQEQTQITIIHALEIDLCSAKSVTQQITHDADQMLKKTVDIRSQIFDKQKLISSLESDYVSLEETLDLIQQERIGVSAKLLEKRLYYSKLREGLNSKLLQNQLTDSSRIWTLNMYPEEEVSKQKLRRELNTVQTELKKIRNAKHDLLSENNKLETKGIDMTSLEDEHKALSSDKNGEKEYLQTLQLQIERLKGISQVTRCACEQEYKVEASLHVHKNTQEVSMGVDL
ncbi:hypothetical protein V2J09_000630 [Rumex salicifolius]